MINTPREQKLIRQLLRERQLTQAIIDAAQDLKAVAGDPSPLLLSAEQKLERAITAYCQETT